MQTLSTFRDRKGGRFAVPDDELEAFRAEVPDAEPVEEYRDPRGGRYAVPPAELDAFRAEVPDAERVRRVRVADGGSYAVPDSEREQFLSAYRQGQEFRQDREGTRSALDRQAPRIGALSYAGAVLKGAGEGAVRGVSDTGVALAKGVIGVPETAVGILDIPTKGYAGKAVEALGADFQASRQALDTLLSPEQQAANRQVQAAQGFRQAVVERIKHPTTLAGEVVESMPTMLAGGVVGRGVAGLAPALAPYAAGIGEGLVSAGQALEQTRQQQPSGTVSLGQTGAAVASGALTALIGIAGGRLADKLGVADLDVIATKGQSSAVKLGILKRVFGGAFTEALEELGQSSQEKAFDNIANRRPLLEGVPEAGAAGAMAGGVMGAGANVLSVSAPVPDPGAIAALRVLEEIRAAKRALEEIRRRQMVRSQAGRPAPAASSPAAAGRPRPNDPGAIAAERALEEIRRRQTGQPPVVSVPAPPPAPPAGAPSPTARPENAADWQAGARAAAAQAAQAAGTMPSTWTAKTPDGALEVAGDWVIRDLARDVRTSQDPGYPAELQPRTRSSAASKGQIAGMAARPDANLLGLSPTTDTGAMLLDQPGNLISGNGRTLALREAYRNGTAGEYRAFVEAAAARLGQSTEGMAMPGLFRRLAPRHAADLARIAELSNRPAVLARAPSELAVSDAAELERGGLLAAFEPDDRGAIRTRSNEPFLNAFAQAVSDASLRTHDGGFDAGIDGRVRNAVLYALAGQSEHGRTTARQVIENERGLDLTPQVDAIVGAARDLVAAAEANPAYDLRPGLSAAMDLLVRWRTEAARGSRQSFEQFLSQQDLFAGETGQVAEQLARDLSAARDAVQARDMLRAYAAAARAVVPAGESLFGEAAGADAARLDLLERARAKAGYAPDPALEQARQALGLPPPAPDGARTAPAAGSVPAAPRAAAAAHEHDMAPAPAPEHEPETAKRRHRTDLAPDQQQVHDGLYAVVDDTERADRDYAAISDETTGNLANTYGGKVIGTDLARFLSRAYYTWAGRVRHTKSTAAAAAEYAKGYLIRRIKNPPKRADGQPPRLAFTAGGVASGKSTVLTPEYIAGVDLVSDGQMKTPEKAIEEIELALANGWKVYIDYIQRPFDMVVRGAIGRGLRQGRWGDLRELPGLHMQVQRSIEQVARHFEGNPRVTVRVHLNNQERQADGRTTGSTTVVPVFDVAAGGRLRYDDPGRLRSIVDEQYAAYQAAHGHEFTAEQAALFAAMGGEAAEQVSIRFAGGYSGARPDRPRGPAPGAAELAYSPWPSDFPRIAGLTSGRGLQTAGLDPGEGLVPANDQDAEGKKVSAAYKAAKGGDRAAADKVVLRLHGPKQLEKLRSLARRHPGAILVPVRAQEASGRNRLPESLARFAGEQTGLALDESIVQTNRPRHTGAGALERMARPARFAGDVQPGAAYILVDDFLTSGGTVAELRAYIEGRGGRVVDVLALAVDSKPQGGYSGDLAVHPKTLLALKEKFGYDALREWLHRHNFRGGHPEALTNVEARSLLSFATLDAAGARILQAESDALAPGAGGTAPGLPEGGAREPGLLRQAEGGGAPGLPGSAGVAEAGQGYAAAKGLSHEQAAALQAEVERLQESSDSPYRQGDLFAEHAPVPGVPGNPDPGQVPGQPSEGRVPGPLTGDQIAAWRAAFTHPLSVDAWKRAWDLSRGERVSTIIRELLLGRRVDTAYMVGYKIASPRDFAALLLPLRSPFVESIKIAYLDKSNRIVRVTVATIGGQDYSSLSPHSLFYDMPAGCDRVYIAHNHPSGDPQPSAEDSRVTKRVLEAAQSLGVAVVDHVITNGQRYVSLRHHVLRDGQNIAELPDHLRVQFPKAPHVEPGQGRNVPDNAFPSQAEWEIVPRGTTINVNDPSILNQVASALRQANPTAGHAILLSSKNRIVAVLRLPMPGVGETQAWTQLFGNVQRAAYEEGANAILLDLPATSAQLSHQVRAFQRQLDNSQDVRLLDVAASDSPSMREAGTMVVSEAPAAYGTPFSLDATPAAPAGPAAAGAMQAPDVADDPGFSQLLIELPEIVEWAQAALGGAYPEVRPQLARGALGSVRFAASGAPERMRLKASNYQLVQPTEQAALLAQAEAEAQAMHPPGEIDAATGQPAWIATRDSLFTEAFRALHNSRLDAQPRMAAAVAAHEVGHIADAAGRDPGTWEDVRRRGNVLGHIAAMMDWTRHFLAESPGGRELEKSVRDRLARRASKAAADAAHALGQVAQEALATAAPAAATGWTPQSLAGELQRLSAGMPALSEWLAALSHREQVDVARQVIEAVREARLGRAERAWTLDIRRRLFAEAMAERRTLWVKQVRHELEQLMLWWNGYDRLPPADHVSRSPAELFADGWSVFLNNPAALARRAPMFHRALSNYLAVRPDVSDAYEAFQSRVHAGQGTVDDARLARLYDAFGPEKSRIRKSLGALATRRSRAEAFDEIYSWVGRDSGPVHLRIRRARSANAGLADQAEAALQRMLARSGMVYALMADTNHQVGGILERAGVNWDDLRVYVLLDRIANEPTDVPGKGAANVANPLGLTTPAARSLLDRLRERVGDARYQGLTDAAAAWQDLWQTRVLDQVEAAGLWNEQLMTWARHNQAYWTFVPGMSAQQLRSLDASLAGLTDAQRQAVAIETVVSRQYGGHIAGAVLPRVGTHREVSDPFGATLRRAEQLLTAATRNTLKLRVEQLLQQTGDPLYSEAKLRRDTDGRLVPPPDEARRSCVIVMDRGQPRAYWAPAPIARFLNGDHSAERSSLVRFGIALNNITKAAHTIWAVGFWPRAAWKDARAWNVQMPDAPWGGPLSWIPGSTRLFGPGAFRTGSREYYKSQAIEDARLARREGILTPAARKLYAEGWYFAGRNYRDLGPTDSIDAADILRSWGLEPKRPFFRDDAELSRLQRAAQYVADTWVGRAASWWLEKGAEEELANKLAGMLYAEERLAGRGEGERRRIVAELAGSPNFADRPRAGAFLDIVVKTFYNPWKESLYSIGTAATRDPVGFSLRFALKVGLPTTAIWMLRSGAAEQLLAALWRPGETPEDEEDRQRFLAALRRARDLYRRVPDYYLTRYTTLPLSGSGAERVIAMTLPEADAFVPLRSVLWHSLEELGQQIGLQPKTPGDLGETVRGAFSDIPVEGRSILGQTLFPFATFLMGQNPYDPFYGRHLLTDDEFAAARVNPMDLTGRAAPAWRKLGQNAWNSLLGGMVGRFDMRTPSARDAVDSDTKRLLNLPLMQPIVGRWVREIGGGLQAEVNAATAPVIADDAFRRIMAGRIVEAWKNTGGRPPQWALDKMRSDPFLAEAVANGIADYMRLGNLTPREREIVDPRTRGTRLKALQMAP